MKPIFLFLFSLLIISCGNEPTQLESNIWRATLDVKDQKELPFIVEWTRGDTLIIHNAEERIVVSDIKRIGDSIIINHPVFEGVLKGIVSGTLVQGQYIKPSLNRSVPFTMRKGDSQRFNTKAAPAFDVSGGWEMIFSGHDEENRYIAKGIFKQTSNGTVEGTIRTTTGDYRFLEGVMDGNILKLSTFDGAHAFLFEAEVRDSLLFGNFYSGNHWKEPFSAVKNNTYELPDENKLTYLKEGFDQFDFAFPNTKGDTISLHDVRFKDKVVVVQIMGTWCPNCLEETQYYTEYLAQFPSDQVEFVSLAFEYAPTQERAIHAIERLKKSVGVPYPILLAQFGSSSKKKANEKLPMLNHVLSYPTTIFIDKKGEVRKIHTGFNGKATGEKFTTYVAEFESFMETLKSE